MPDNIVNVEIKADATEATTAVDAFATGSASELQKFATAATQSLEQVSTATQSSDASLTSLASTIASLDPWIVSSALSLGRMELGISSVANSSMRTNVTLAEMVPLLSTIAISLRNVVAAVDQVGTGFTANAARVEAGSSVMAASVLDFGNKAKLSAINITSVMSLVGAAFAGASIVGIFTRQADEVKELNRRMRDLSDTTGMSKAELVELRDVFSSMGEPVNVLERVIPRLAKAMEGARVEGSRQSEAFRRLGIDTHGWSQELPPTLSVIQQLAIHLAQSTNFTQDAAEAQKVLGIGSIGVASALRAQGEQLLANMGSFRDHGEAIDKATEASNKLMAAEARLSAMWSTTIAKALPGVVEALRFVILGYDVLAVKIGSVTDYARVFITQTGAGFSALGEAMKLFIAGDIGGASKVIVSAVGQIRVSTESMFEGIKEGSALAMERIKADFAKDIPQPKISGETNEDFFAIKESKVREFQAKQIEGRMHHEVSMLALEKQRFENEEKLGTISAAANLKRLQDNNDASVRVQEKYINQLIALAAQDPNGIAKVQTLKNEIQAVNDKAAHNDLALVEHVAAKKLKSEEDLERAYKLMTEHMAADDEKAAKHREQVSKSVLDEGIATSQKVAEAYEHSQQLKGLADEKHSEKLAEMRRKDIENEFNIGLISLRQRDKQLKESFDAEVLHQKAALDAELKQMDAYNAAYLAKRMALQQLLLVFENNPGQQDSVKRQLQQLDGENAQFLLKKQELNNKIQQLTDKVLEQERNAYAIHLKKLADQYKPFINAVGSAFQTNIMSWIQGTQTFSQAFLKMGGDILSSWIGTLIKMGAEFVQRKALELAIHLTTNSAKAASDTTTATTASIAGSAEALARIIQLAAVAGAGAFAATAAIPFIGPALAPGAAAEATASVLALAPLAFAEKGALVGDDQLMYLHKNEMVLPPNLSKGVQNLISGGDPSGGGGKQGTVIHAPFSPVIQGWDTRDISRVLKEHRDAYISEMKQWHRDGHFA